MLNESNITGQKRFTFWGRVFWHSTRHKFGAWILKFQFKFPCTYFKFNAVILLKN